MQIKEFRTENFLFKNYTELTEVESRKIWEGRNHPAIRKWMTNPEPFTWESHQGYVEGLKKKDDRSYWAVIHDNAIIGSMCLNPIGKYPPPKKYCTDNQIIINAVWAETGMFLLPEFIGKGLGTSMKKEFIDYILANTNIEVLLLKTQRENIRTIKLNQSLGYQIFNEDEAYVYMMKTK